MLRITEYKTGERPARLRLEGALFGPWVDELRRLARADNGKPSGIELDVSALGFADPTGARLLQELSRDGWRLVGVTPYISALLAGLEGGGG